MNNQPTATEKTPAQRKAELSNFKPVIIGAAGNKREDVPINVLSTLGAYMGYTLALVDKDGKMVAPLLEMNEDTCKTPNKSWDSAKHGFKAWTVYNGRFNAVYMAGVDGSKVRFTFNIDITNQ